RRGDGALARAAAVPHARALLRAPHLPAPRLLLRGAPDRCRPPRAEPARVGLLLRALGTRRSPAQLQPRRARDVHDHERADRALLSPPCGTRARLTSAAATRASTAARFTPTTSALPSARTGRQDIAGSAAATAIDPVSA